MTNDGTQDPGPPPVLSDPSAGLVTGSHYAPEPLKVRVVEPPMPDISAVREAMAGMLDEDSELNFDLVRPAGSESPAERTAEIPVQASSPENAPEQQADSEPEPEPTPPAGIPAQAQPATSTATVPEPRGGTVRLTPGNVEQPRRMPARFRRERPPKPAGAIGRKSSAPSVAATMVLLLVIAVLVIVLIGSFLDTIGSLFA